jgi:hypothetical protein
VISEKNSVAAGKPVTYAQLLETNNLLQNCGDETYWLCVTRTVQESKLFPVPSYMLLSYLNAFYRYPTLLRKIEERMPAEAIADRVRSIGVKIQSIGISWTLPGFYLLGREMLINMGLIRPTDALEDVVYVMDFWKRYSLSWRRNDGHITAAEAGHRSQIFPERRLQVFESDLYACEAGDELHTAAVRFMATASQYAFLVSCESRISLNNSGPYKLGPDKEMIVRDFMDLAEHDYPWLDGVAKDVPYNNLTVPIAVKDTHFYIMDDWGSFEATPEFRAEKICGVALYTSDALTETHTSVGMGSRAELVRTFDQVNDALKDATSKLWKRFAGYTRDQMLDAGALIYYSIVKDLAHIAGCYESDDWMMIDERAERFRPLLNDEYGATLLGSLLVPLTMPSNQCSEYTMMHHAETNKRLYTPLSYSVLGGEEYVPSVGGMRPGASHLAPKLDRYRTTAGILTQAEYNARCGSFTPELCSEKFRYLDETWVKYNYTSQLANELYEIEQRSSRKLKGRGAGLLRADLESLND